MALLLLQTLFLAITLAAFEQSYPQVTRTSTGSELTMWPNCTRPAVEHFGPLLTCLPLPLPSTGSMRRALNSLLAFVQGVTACCSCCGRLRRRRTADDADLASARWKSSGQAEGVLDDGAPPELSEAAAKQAAAALSAAMSAKLAAAAGLGGGTVPAAAKAPLGTGSKSPPAQPSLPLHPAAQQQLPEDSLIKAGPLVAPATSGAAATDGQAAAAADQLDEVHKLSHIDSLVQYFERLSPSKAQHAHAEQQQQQQPSGGPAAVVTPAADSLELLAQAAAAQVPAAGPLAGGSSFSEASSREPAGTSAAGAAAGSGTATAADSKPRPLPRRTESRRAFLRAISRHARFAGVPEGDEEGSTCGSGAADEPADSLESSSPAASPGAALLTGKQPGSAALAGTKNTSTGRPTISSRLQRGSAVQGGSYDAQVAAELQDADGASDFSGISGNSSGKLQGLVLV